MDIEHTAIGALATGLLGAAALAYNRVAGDPKQRMDHAERLAKLEAEESGAAIEVLRTEIVELRQQLLAQSKILGEQATQIALEQSSVKALRDQLREQARKIKALEDQLITAGNVHTADLATVANLRHELEEAQAEICRLQSRVAELEAQLALCGTADRCKAKAKPSSKKKSSKKKR